MLKWYCSQRGPANENSLGSGRPKKRPGFFRVLENLRSKDGNSCSNILFELLEMWLFTLVSKGVLRACLRECDPRL